MDAAGALLGPPIVGFIYDQTGSYTLGAVFSGVSHLLGVCSLCCIPSLQDHIAELRQILGTKKVEGFNF